MSSDENEEEKKIDLVIFFHLKQIKNKNQRSKYRFLFYLPFFPPFAGFAASAAAGGAAALVVGPFLAALLLSFT